MAEGRYIYHMAQRRRAKALELRAATSLARLWRQGKTVAAWRMLAELYGWLTEGYATKEPQEAQAPPEQLNQTV